MSKDIKKSLGIFDNDIYREYFDNTIRYRGEAIVANNKINNIQHNNNTYKAIVEGTNDYAVSVTFKKNSDEIDNSNCTCPYFTEGKGYCKHIYALIYQIKCFDNKKIIKKKLRKKYLAARIKAQRLNYLMNANKDLFTDKTNIDYKKFFNDYLALSRRIKKNLRNFTCEDDLLENVKSLEETVECIDNTYKNVKNQLNNYNLANFLFDYEEAEKQEDDDIELDKEALIYDLTDEERQLVKSGEFSANNFENPGDEELEDDDYYKDDEGF